ncbi:transmembrane protein 65-like [Lepeophtheirus salmonis]|uniref:transmembrane protein 65-like n=1 Tax=Lepeophtheirus salmonis TaxID=72036 RepID=UPI001AE2CC1A|nr:transmembrane protein 65-like [Lepeophtheirus salmonis]
MLSLRSRIFIRQLWTPTQASSFVKDLSPSDRKELMNALEKSEESSSHDVVPQKELVRLHCLYSGLPFVGFGFLDNAVMIVAGESIEWTIGASFCISTMAAAALGNTLSDVFGMGSAWYVERFTLRFSGGPPKLSSEQLHSKPFRVASTFGRTVGVIIGCLLGMFPLLFIDDRKSKETIEGE